MRDFMRIVETGSGYDRTIYPIKNGEVEILVREFRSNRYSFSVYMGERKVAYGQFDADPLSGKGSVQEIVVSESYRRRGIATAIYNHFEQMGFEVVPSDDVKPDGQAFWGARGY